MCILSGAWVEATAKMLGDAVNVDIPPFVHVRYVVSEDILESDIYLYSYFFPEGMMFWSKW